MRNVIIAGLGIGFVLAGCTSSPGLQQETVQVSVTASAADHELASARLGAGDTLGEVVFAEQWAGLWSTQPQGPRYATGDDPPTLQLNPAGDAIVITPDE